MKTTILVSSKSPDVRRMLERKRESLVPKELRQKLGDLTLHSLEPSSSIGDFCQRILWKADGRDLICLAIDDYDSFLRPELYEGILIGRYSAADAIANVGNVFGRLFSVLLRNALFMKNKFDNMSSFRALTLPTKVFDASEVCKLVEIAASHSVDRSFPTVVDKAITAINGRQTPKKFGSGRQHFLRDDQDLYFKLDETRHRRVNTSYPHDELCRLRAFFRFGVALDRHRHFDVSRGKPKQKLSGSFHTCHGPKVSVACESHLNVFPNGYLEV